MEGVEGAGRRAKVRRYSKTERDREGERQEANKTVAVRSSIYAQIK